MSYIEKEKLIKADIVSIENRVRHAFNQGYDLGFKDGEKRAKPQEKEPCEDSISRQAVVYYIKSHIHEIITESGIDKNEHTNKVLMAIINGVETMPSVNQQRWIPIKTRPLTEEEKEEYADLGYSKVLMNFMYDCPLPEDGEEVLITTRYGEVTTDTFYRDDGCYFETYCDDDDVKAWMSLPEPYKAESEE